VLKEVPEPPLKDQNDLRLVAVDGAELVLAWVSSEDEHVSNTLRVPRELYDEIAADNEDWKPLRDELSADPFVDFNRLIAADPAEETEQETGIGPLAAATESDAEDQQEEEEDEGKAAKKPGGKKSKAAPKSKKKSPAAKAPAKKKKKK